MAKSNRKKDAEPETQNGQAPAAVQAVAPTAQPSANGAEDKNRPVKTFSCPAGMGVYVEASVWPKEIQLDGKTVTVYNATCRKSYKKDDGSYGNTQFFRGSEIPIAIHVLELAARWILTQRTDEEPPF